MINTHTSVSLFLITLKNFQNRNLAVEILELMKLFPEFTPAFYDESEPVKKIFDWKDIDTMIDTWMNEEQNSLAVNEGYALRTFLAERKQKCKTSFQVSWGKSQYAHFNLFAIDVNATQVSNKEYWSKFMELCTRYIRIIEPVYGKIELVTDFESGPIDLEIRYPELQWMNIFGEPYINLFGREHLLATPCHQVHQISDSIIGLQLTESVVDEITDTLRKQIKQHLGEEAFVIQGIKNMRRYKPGKVPVFDYTNVLSNPSKPVKIRTPFNRYH
ncbi:hypothetical protein [Paenibacillus wulumuqiensis]|uniref:hypothetical protein n=1 Tax=Paenibacillus wulumuqiensis TaxID=1567107 RepID=UPI000619F312|nr:hypothetical protein [Paenibacillus wulumuqiensis]